MKRITADHVAELAGVSRSAVSRAFTESASISVKTRDKVLAASRQLGYRPNGMASSLAKSKSDIVAIVAGNSPDLREPHFYQALNAALQDFGKTPIIIEDATGDSNKPIFEFEHAVERIAAVCDAAAGLPFLVTARAENFLYGRPDLDDTITRLQAFSDAGADVLYAPGLTDLDDIRVLCQAVDKPVNVVMGLSGAQASIEDLQSAGVKRVSVGGSFARAALGEFIRAAEEVKNNGTFTYADRAISDSDAAAYMSNMKRPGNKR